MSTSNNASPLKPLIVGLLFGFVVGLVLGLVWAWMVQPVTYAGGSHPNELSEQYQQTYVQSVSEAYFTTRDLNTAAARLALFSPQEKVALLAQTSDTYRAAGRDTEADMVGDLSSSLSQAEGWSADDVSAGLATAGASEAFALKMGQVLEAPDSSSTVPATVAPSDAQEVTGAKTNWLKVLLITLAVIVVIVIILFLLTRIKPKQRPKEHASKAKMEQVVTQDGEAMEPLRQWVGAYTAGQDSFDESFTVETDDSDFLGECGMGILEGFAAGSPKKVMAFDVWLFDKTDIRTISVPVMSKFAFEDDVFRGKLPPDSNPVLATEGGTFDIETSALLVKAKIEEAAYGDGPPEMSYFTSIKVSLAVYLKPGVDVSAPMGTPEGYDD
ncbi:MAG TPA: hypothetical protein G4N96_11620 [Chloroflexi bacterium]|nr:hypothetical protein [Chloroflexota bacterium]